MKKTVKNISNLIALNIKLADAEIAKNKNIKTIKNLNSKIGISESLIVDQLNLIFQNKKREKKKNKIFIPNYNTFSTLVDRLSVEHVKLHHFKVTMKNSFKKNELKDRLSLQTKMIGILQIELIDFLETVMSQNDYNFLFEKRTFV